MGRRWGQRSQAEAPGGDVALGPEASKPAGPPLLAGTSQSSGRPRRAAPCATGPLAVWWVEKGGVRHDRSLRLDDGLPAEEVSEAAWEYRLRIKAQFLRSQGAAKEDVAAELGRAAGWVSLWWQKPPDQVPRPRDVPPYIAEYNLRMLQLGVEPYRPAVLRRRYVEETDGLYLECAQQMPWRQAVFRKRNYDTGEVTVTSIASSRQDCSYRSLHTGIPRLDDALGRIRRDFGIRDPRAYLLNNFYPDGNTSIAPHNHDFWSAILSFGAPRVFTLDGAPILLGDGDLLVLGTQRHGVPKMPAVKDGRVSVAIFWFPESEGEPPCGEDSACAQCGRRSGLLQESLDGASYCADCWQSWWDAELARPGDRPAAARAEGDDDLLAAVLELSLREF